MSREFAIPGGYVNDTGGRDFAVPFGFLAGEPLPPPPTGGGIKVWSGSAWVEKPAKYWNGSAWVTKPAKYWNGSAWVTLGGAPAGPWTPAAITADIAAWLQADMLAGTEGTPFSSWSDSGPSGATFATLAGHDPAILKANYQNSKNVAYFFRATMGTSLNFAFNDFAVYIVWSGFTPAFTARLVDHNYECFWVGRGAGATDFGGGVFQTADPYGQYISGVDTGWHVTLNSRVGTTYRVRDNGGTRENTFAVVSTPTTSYPIYLGGEVLGVAKAEMVYIAELLILDQNVETNMTKVEGYLAHKWALQSLLPADHPYKGAAP